MASQIENFISALGLLLKLRPKTSATKVSVLQVLAGASLRPGLSVERSMINYISAKDAAGLPTGPYPDGTPNYDEVCARAMYTELYRALLEDAVVTAAVPANIAIQANGANVGGPVASVGQTIQPVNAYGIIQ